MRVGIVMTARPRVMTSLHVLAEGEDRYGDLARDSTGHVAMALLTFAAGNPQFGASLEPDEADAMRRLLEWRGTTAADRQTARRRPAAEMNDLAALMA